MDEKRKKIRDSNNLSRIREMARVLCWSLIKDHEVRDHDKLTHGMKFVLQNTQDYKLTEEEVLDLLCSGLATQATQTLIRQEWVEYRKDSDTFHPIYGGSEDA